MATLYFLGPEGTFSHHAAQTMVQKGETLMACADFREVFRRAAEDPEGAAVVPFENSTRGTIAEVMELLAAESRLDIVSCSAIPIRHHLLTRDAATTITRIYSKAEALAQCRETLSQRYPGIPLLAASSTAEAARRACDDPTVGAVAGTLTAKRYRLQVREANLQDLSDNTTRFFRLERHGHRSPLPTTHLLLHIAISDRPGTLLAMLEPMKHLDLTYIQSIPITGKHWKYAFFVELATKSDDNLMDTLPELLRPVTKSVRCLGAYPLLAEDALAPAPSLSLAELRTLIAALDRRLVEKLCEEHLDLPPLFTATEGIIRSPAVQALDKTAEAFAAVSKIRRHELEDAMAGMLLPGDAPSEAFEQLLEQRLCCSRCVIERKYKELGENFVAAMQTYDSDIIETALLNEAVETQVLARVTQKATEKGAPELYISALREWYRGYMLPLSRRIQLLYALKR